MSPEEKAARAAPSGLGNRGRALWRSVVADYPAGTGPDRRERAILAMAARQADDLLRLEKAIAKYGVMSTGSKQQLVVNPAEPEARQARLAINRLLGELAIPDEDEQPRTAASRRGQHAANTRYDELDRKRERRAARGA